MHGKTSRLLAFLLLILSVLISCSASTEEQVIEITVNAVINPENASHRIIEPSDISGIGYYQLAVKDPFGVTAVYPSADAYNSIESSVSVNVVTCRAYTFSILGFIENNGAYKQITSDSYEKVFYGAVQSILNLPMHTLVEDFSSEISLVFYLPEIVMPRNGMPDYTVKIEYTDGTEAASELANLAVSTIPIDTGDGLCLTAEIQNLQAGVATITITFTNPDTHVSRTAVEIMRLYPGLVSSGTMDFRYMTSSDAPASDGVYGVAWVLDEHDDTKLYRLLPEGVSVDSYPDMKVIDDPYDIVTDAVRLEPMPSINGSIGSSPFDSIAPWSEITLVAMNSSGLIQDTLEENETISAFTADNTARDIMVDFSDLYYLIGEGNLNVEGSDKEARFYYVSSREFDGTIEGHSENASLHPGSAYYVGRYQATSVDSSIDNAAVYVRDSYDSMFGYSLNNTFNSRPSSNPIIESFNIACAHDWIHETRDSSSKGFGALDWPAYSYIQLLYLIEYADWDSAKIFSLEDSAVDNQAYAGETDSMEYHTGISRNRNTHFTGQYRYIEGFGNGNAEVIDGLSVDLSDYSINFNSNTSDSGVRSFGTFYNVVGYDQDYWESRLGLWSSKIGALPAYDGDLIPATGFNYVNSDSGSIGLPASDTGANSIEGVNIYYRHTGTSRGDYGYLLTGGANAEIFSLKVFENTTGITIDGTTSRLVYCENIPGRN